MLGVVCVTIILCEGECPPYIKKIVWSLFNLYQSLNFKVCSKKKKKPCFSFLNTCTVGLRPADTGKKFLCQRSLKTSNEPPNGFDEFLGSQHVNAESSERSLWSVWS